MKLILFGLLILLTSCQSKTPVMVSLPNANETVVIDPNSLEGKQSSLGKISENQDDVLNDDEKVILDEKDIQTYAYRNKQKSYFDWPVDEARLSRGFLPNKRRAHLGIDLAARKGSSIFASHDGMVIYVGAGFKGFGRMIMIEGDRGYATLYAHLSKTIVKEGEEVLQGAKIGEMGRSGRATGVHLHFEIRQKSGPLDPMPLLPKTN